MAEPALPEARITSIAGQGQVPISRDDVATDIKRRRWMRLSLHPLPPGESKQKDVRYLDIHEDDQLDESQFADWVKQASRLPGERM